MSKKILLSGSSNLPLAQRLSKLSHIKLTKINISKFPCSETRIHILDSLKNKNVFIVQSISEPTNDNIIELALIADATKRLLPKKITAIIPWLGYSPQDKVFRKGEPLSSKVIAKLLESTPIEEFIVMDIHSNLVLKKFTKKIKNTSAITIFVDYVKEEVLGNKDWVVASLDKGCIPSAIKFSKFLKLDLVKFNKTRDRTTGEITLHSLQGNVKDKNVIVFDDYVSTGGTLIKSANYLKSKNAKKYWCCVTHVIVKDTLNKIENSEINKFVTTNSINIPNSSNYKKTTVLDISPIILEEILY